MLIPRHVPRHEEGKNCLAYLVGSRYEPDVRRLVTELEEALVSGNKPGSARVLAALRAKLRERRGELFAVCRYWRNSESVAEFRFSGEPALKALGQWVTALPLAVIPGLTDEFCNEFGLDTSIRDTGFREYRRLMGENPKPAMEAASSG